jgi:hypothetical protein
MPIPLIVDRIAVLDDNYIWVMHAAGERQAVVIDPAWRIWQLKT